MKRPSLLYLFILSFTLIFTNCKKSGGDENENEPSEPIKTEKGVAKGTPTSKTIGPSGGELTTPDGKVRVVVPQGAVSSNTPFSIQPITNTLYKESEGRTAYRLLPEGTTFAKPIQLVFQYEEADLANTVEDVMTVAWQQANGTWKVEPTRLNKQANTLTVETTHFSDWTATGGFELEVEKRVIKSKESTKISVKSIVNDDDLLAPGGLNPEHVAPLTALGDWKIIKGNGKISPNTTGSKGFAPSAVYIAPSTVRNIEHVEITVNVEGFNKVKDPSAPGGIRQTGKMILIASILVSDNFMVGKFNGVEFGFFGDEVWAGNNQGLIYVQGGTQHDNQITLSASAAVAGSYPCGHQHLPGKSQVAVFIGTKSYTSFYIECNQFAEYKFSPSVLEIPKWPAVGELAEGSFKGIVYLPGVQCGFDEQVELDLRFSITRTR